MFLTIGAVRKGYFIVFAVIVIDRAVGSAKRHSTDERFAREFWANRSGWNRGIAFFAGIDLCISAIGKASAVIDGA